MAKIKVPGAAITSLIHVVLQVWCSDYTTDDADVAALEHHTLGVLSYRHSRKTHISTRIVFLLLSSGIGVVLYKYGERMTQNSY